MPLQLKYTISAEQRLQNYAAAVRSAIEASGDLVVDDPAQADVLLEVRDPHAAAPHGGITTGNIREVGNLNIGGQQTISGMNIAMGSAIQQISASAGLSDAQKNAFSQWVELMEAALKQAAEKGDSETVKEAADKTKAVIAQVTDSQPKWQQAKISAEGLIAAARNLAAAAPLVLPIAQEVLKFIAPFIR